MSLKKISLVAICVLIAGSNVQGGKIQSKEASLTPVHNRLDPSKIERDYLLGQKELRFERSFDYHDAKHRHVILKAKQDIEFDKWTLYESGYKTKKKRSFGEKLPCYFSIDEARDSDKGKKVVIKKGQEVQVEYFTKNSHNPTTSRRPWQMTPRSYWTEIHTLKNRSLPSLIFSCSEHIAQSAGDLERHISEYFDLYFDCESKSETSSSSTYEGVNEIDPPPYSEKSLAGLD